MICNKCNLDKPIDKFYFIKDKNRYRKDCNDCQAKRGREFYHLHLEIARIKGRNNYKKHKVQRRNYYRSWYAKNGRDRAVDYAEAIAEWRKNNPEKVKAKQMVRKAIGEGKIIKPKICYDCKRETRLSGHHPDYSKPLEVVWLCSSCHKLRHNHSTSH